MTVVSSKEFVCNGDKYFDIAKMERVFVKRESDNIMFIVTRDKSPDDDLRGAITIDEVFDTVKDNIRKKYESISKA